MVGTTALQDLFLAAFLLGVSRLLLVFYNLNICPKIIVDRNTLVKLSVNME